jgi:cytochrome b561
LYLALGQALTSVGLYAERLTVALGFVTLFFALATFASCRSCLSFLSYIGVKDLTNQWWFKPFYNLHGYYWYGFLILLTIHLLAAVMHTAVPNLADPDGLIHLIILSFGIVSLVFTGTVLSSCRSLVGLITLFSEKSPLNNLGYRSFYRTHSLLWGILFLAIAGHFASGYFHVGFWPG